MAPLLEVRNLETQFKTQDGVVRAVNNVSFYVNRSETLGIVGESGSGKSVTSLSVMRLIPNPPGRISGGEVMFDGQDILKISEEKMRALRGNRIAMIFQDPMTSLNPVLNIGQQITESLILHLKLSAREARDRAIELLNMVGIPGAARRIDEYPHQFSGGMRQRVMIAMALACNPELLIADEPTTALDVTTQAEILDLIKKLQVSHGMAVMFITHDMGVVAEIADRVIVMNHGKIVENGPVDQIFHSPQDDYTRMLIGSVLKLGRKADLRVARAELSADALPILEVRDLAMHFTQGKNITKAVDGVSLSVLPGESLGIVGESGSGKTTMGRCLLRVYEPTAGQINYRQADGSVIDLMQANKATLKQCRRDIRMIFQDPVSSLNPRMTVAQIIGEPLLVNGIAKGPELDERVAHLLEQVGMEPAWRERYPHAFSGGQRQRIGIARAIALNPRLIVADEATSALDVSLRSQMLDLLLKLQDELGLSFIFISHDIAVIRYFCDRVAVMHRGKVVETGVTEQICDHPKHPYTQALLSAIPRPDPRARNIHNRFRYDENALKAAQP